MAVPAQHHTRRAAGRNGGGKTAELVRWLAFAAVDDVLGGCAACHERSNPATKTERRRSDLRICFDRCAHVIRYDFASIDEPCGHPYRIKRRLRFGLAILGKVPRTVWICPYRCSWPSQINVNIKVDLPARHLVCSSMHVLVLGKQPIASDGNVATQRWPRIADTGELRPRMRGQMELQSFSANPETFRVLRGARRSACHQASRRLKSPPKPTLSRSS